MSSNLDNWIHRISENELPIFKYTVSAINNVVSDDDSSTSDLSHIILRDANLTARVLRVANSATYNATGSTISTISRAIVYIGFNLVRDISMSLAIIDALLTGKAKEHVMKLMASSFHAAVQARDYAERRGDSSAEEVFIAALLSNLGEMIFWCVAGEDGDRIIELMEQQDFSPEMAQKEVLGFTFDELTVGLTRDWHISDLLHSAINNPKMKNPRIQDIVLSQELSEASLAGWEGTNTKSVAKKIAAHVNVNEAEANKILRDNAEKAAEIAQLYGAGSIVKYLPLAEKTDLHGEQNEDEFIAEAPEPNPLLQLDILRDLSGAIESKPNFNLVLEIILEGIYRGVGLDRTLFALLTPDKKDIKAKYALGKDNEVFMGRFQFSLRNENIFTDLLKNGTAVWVKDSQSKDFLHPIAEDIRLILASKAFYLAPILVNGKAIGLVYADRQPSGRELDISSFEGFKHFIQQANQALNFISQQKH